MGSFGSIPSNSQSEFVKNCGELNGKKLTADNIQKLNGWTYLKGTPAKGAIINESIEKLKNKRDPWFAIYNVNDTDGTWVCNIFLNKDQTTIKAVPDYYYE